MVIVMTAARVTMLMLAVVMAGILILGMSAVMRVLSVVHIGCTRSSRHSLPETPSAV